MKYFTDITQTVGNTPMVKLNRVVEGVDFNVFAKLEYFNPSASVKDRIAVNMIYDAERRGDLLPGGVIIEATSGNTGIGLAMVGAARGYRVIIIMPENVSTERIMLIKAFGGEVHLTPKEEGMSGSRRLANELAFKEKGYIVQQFANNSNVVTHEESTAIEILNDLDGMVDGFLSAVGTGGTFTGVGHILKTRHRKTKMFAVQPSESRVLSGESSNPHKILGIGPNFVPEIIDLSLADGILDVTSEEAITMAKRLAKEEGILSGISGGAAVAAVYKIPKGSIKAGGNLVLIIPSFGERYISTSLFDEYRD